MKLYPNKKEFVSIENILVDYTIYSDLKFYGINLNFKKRLDKI